jgi:hypothetical protein
MTQQTAALRELQERGQHRTTRVLPVPRERPLRGAGDDRNHGNEAAREAASWTPKASAYFRLWGHALTQAE